MISVINFSLKVYFQIFAVKLNFQVLDVANFKIVLKSLI